MSSVKPLVIAVVSLLVGLGAGWGLSGTEAKRTDIRWSYGDAELVIDLEKDLADDETLLGKIFSREYSAAGAQNWLRQEQNLYHYTDPALAQQLGNLTFDDPAARELRELRDRRQGPWAYQAQEVRIGVPERDYQPQPGHANVCESGIFFRNNIEVFLPNQPERRILLEASGRYSCPEGYRFPDIQLSRDDALRLFGYNNFSKYETAAAVVVQE